VPRLGGAPARRLTEPLAFPSNGEISLPRPVPTVQGLKRFRQHAGFPPLERLRVDERI
jgi:hypothetical protein